MSNNFPFVLDFDLVTGMCNSGKASPTHRYVKNMASQFMDTEAALAMGDKPIYDFYELNQIPETAGDLKFGTSIVYSGKVGDEYFMTKGHFHTLLDTGEVYYCLSGEGDDMHAARPAQPRQRRNVPARAQGLSVQNGAAARRAVGDQFREGFCLI